MENNETTPPSVIKSGGNVLSITNIDLAWPKARCIRANATSKLYRLRADATSKLYRQVDDIMDILANPKDGEITKFTFLPSLKGNRILIMNNMIFHHNWREPQSNRGSSWSCFYRRDKVYKCKSRLRTEGKGKDIKIIEIFGEHNHKDNHREQILNRVKKNPKPRKMKMFPMDSDIDDDDNDSHMGGHNDAPEADINDAELSRENSSSGSDFTQLEETKVKQEIDIMVPNLEENARASLNENEMDSFHKTLPVVEDIEIKRLNTSDFRPDSEDEPEFKPCVTNSGSLKSAANENDDEYYDNPDDIDITKVSKLRSAKGGEQLCVDGYIYFFKNPMPPKRSMWTCIKSIDNILKCPARVTTISNEENQLRVVHLSNSHTHPIFEDDIKIRLFYEFSKSVPNTDIRKKKKYIMRKSLSELNPEFAYLLGKHKMEKRKELNPLPLDVGPKPKSRHIKADEAITKLYRQVDDAMDALENPTDGEITKFTFLPSVKGNRILIMNKMIYHYQSRTLENDQRFYWTCLDRCDKVHKCKSRLITEGLDKNTKIIKVSGEHNHKSDHREQILKKINQNLKTQEMEMLAMDSEKGISDDNDNHIGGHNDTTKNGTNATGSSRKNSPGKGDFIQLKKSKVEREIDIIEPTLTENTYKSEMDSGHDTMPIIEDIKMECLNTSNFRSDSEDEPEYKPRTTKSRSIKRTANMGNDEDYVPSTKSRIDELNPEHTHKRVKMEEFKYSMKLYSVSYSPPSLAVRMCLKALNIPYELHNVDYIASEHLSEEYAKLNPQKEIPVLDDDGFHLSESVAIMQYLCDKYAGDDNALYPKDSKQHALVNHRLCFNMSFYYSRIRAYSIAPIFFDYERTEMGLKRVKNALSVFETYLQRVGTKFATGNNVTIADFALISATLCLEAIAYDLSGYPLITKWYNTFKKEHADLWSIAQAGLQALTEFEHNRSDLSHMNQSLSSDT